MAGATHKDDAIDGGTVDLAIEPTPQGSIAHLTLNHPRRRNAIGPAVIQALTTRAAELAAMPDLRAVSLRGTAGLFSAGANVKVMATLQPDSARAFITGLHRAIDAIRRLPVPVIAVLEGRCYGAAMELAAACDMRLGTTDLISGMPEVRVGLPSVIEACLLPRLIGWGRTSELLLTGRDVIGPENAEIGFLEKQVQPNDIDVALRRWTDAIRAAAPEAVRAQKQILLAWPPDHRTAIAASIDAFAASYQTGEPTTYLSHALGKKT
ncbi:MAG: enoyl-CoA hydratase-related protein [Pseudomonadota bacterium]